MTARVVALLGAVCLVAGALVATSVPTSAAAVTGSQFNPGNIISDSEFYNGNAMTEQQIQAFLDARIGVCRTSTCLNVLRENVTSRGRLVASNTGIVRCEAFTGGTALRASTIIYRTQVACGISAKAILVMLEKEQSLVSSKGPSLSTLKRAMGFACPDTAPCAVSSLGFSNQVYQGTLQLKTYMASRFAKQPGVQAIQFNPSASCGSRVINVENYATAALYSYTPYQPNAAALANLYTSGDSCSAYGNRNFWVFYNNWFGSTHPAPAPVPVPDILPQNVAVSRLGGADRFNTAVSISTKNFAEGARTVYIANGMDYPDALSAAPAAAKQDAPLLLVRADSIPSAVQQEVKRLQPTQIVVVGGTGVVSDQVAKGLAALAPTANIRRDSGVDRYATSRAVAKAAFPGGAAVAYIATGTDFPDALSAAAAAGSQDNVVILVDGSQSAVDEGTRSVITSLGIKKVIIAGGQSVVGAGIEASLRTVSGPTTVLRTADVDRYRTSEAINSAAFAGVDTTYVASGAQFPDALAGAAVAGARKAPLYLVPATCLRRSMLEQMVKSGSRQMVILGESGVVSAGVAGFTNCK